MAKRESTRDFSSQHEDFIAKQYGGRVSPSSGASPMDPSDVSTEDTLFECKATGHKKPAKSISMKLEVIEKIADEAYAVGLDPAVALRIYNPDSPLSDARGYVDMVCRLVQDDVNRG